MQKKIDEPLNFKDTIRMALYCTPLKDLPQIAPELITDYLKIKFDEAIAQTDSPSEKALLVKLWENIRG